MQILGGLSIPIATASTRRKQALSSFAENRSVELMQICLLTTVLAFGIGFAMNQSEESQIKEGINVINVLQKSNPPQKT